MPEQSSGRHAVHEILTRQIRLLSLRVVLIPLVLALGMAHKDTVNAHIPV